MVLKLSLEKSRILTNKSVLIKSIDDNLLELIINMFDTMRFYGGIGLASSQIGKNISLAVVDISKTEGYENVKPLILINPKILDKSDEYEVEEGCLSIPNQRFMVKRFKKIKLEYCDLELNKKILEAQGLLAEVIQHEVDHLNGILINMIT